MNKVKTIFAWIWQKLCAFWPWYKTLYQGRAWYTKTVVALASCIVAFILYLGAVDINFLWLFGKSPGYFSGILNPQTSEASLIYSADGKLIGKYFNENRTPVEYDEVNPAFFKALVDTEDERFYKHIGIDPIGVFAAAKDALLHHNGRGASTITQQLAKNMFRVRSQYSTGLLGKVPVLRLLIIKSKEWIIAVKLETVFSKKEIITMYANTVDFGSNSYGIKTAAKTYFNTTPKELTTDQAAVLVGMLKATTYYNPRTNPENSLARRNTVLYNMVTHGDLSHAEYDQLKAEPIKLDFKVEEMGEGCYYPDLSRRMAQFELTLLDWAEAHKGSRQYVAFADKCWPAFPSQFGFEPCYVNSRLVSRGIPVACEVDIYGALSEYIGMCASDDTVTLLDINNSVPQYIYDEDIKGKYDYKLTDTFMGFHCGNTPQCKMCSSRKIKYQLIQNRLLENGGTPDFTRGTLEGDIAASDITFYRLQCDSEGNLRSYIAEGEVLDVPTRSFGGIGIFAINEMGRFYRHVLVQKGYPHHGAVAFSHVGKTLFEVFKYLGIKDIAYNQPASLPYPTENPWK
jgi:hypothetical protein